MPYLGLYLTDLTFIEDGNPDLLLVRDETLADDLGASSHQINFAKCQMVAKACNPACNSSCIPACNPVHDHPSLQFHASQAPSLQPYGNPMSSGPRRDQTLPARRIHHPAQAAPPSLAQGK